jgi:hypothetical protein
MLRSFFAVRTSFLMMLDSEQRLLTMTTELAIARTAPADTGLVRHSRFPKLLRLPDFSYVGDSMGDLINLKRFKKRIEREQATKHAQANRARFGRSKSERARDEKRDTRASDLLDQHRLDGEDAS